MEIRPGLFRMSRLPNTGLRFRLPRFRMVINKDRIKNGRGIIPDVWALPSSDAIRDGVDFKAMKVRELIAQQDALTNHDPENK